jgi:hypothetical protein
MILDDSLNNFFNFNNNSILRNKIYKRHFRHECLINECLEKFINELHTILFLRPNEQC